MNLQLFISRANFLDSLPKYNVMKDLTKTEDFDFLVPLMSSDKAGCFMPYVNNLTF